MNRNSRTPRDLGVIGIVALATIACAQPPAELLTEARQAENQALVADAKEYAPEAFDAVTEARVALEAEMAAQAERWSARRSYKQAEVLAQAYLEAGQQAFSQAVTAKDQARETAVAMIAESRSSLEEVRGMLTVAPVGKGSSADLAAMRGDLDAAQAALDAAEASVASELYLEANASAASAREIIGRVKTAVEAARTLRRG